MESSVKEKVENIIRIYKDLLNSKRLAMASCILNIKLSAALRHEIEIDMLRGVIEDLEKILK